MVVGGVGSKRGTNEGLKWDVMWWWLVAAKRLRVWNRVSFPFETRLQ